MLRYITDEVLRRQISATTNKIESYNNFIEWIFYGGHGIIAHNDPIEQEKRIKYNDLVASALIVMNVADMTRILHTLDPDKHVINRDIIATLSPYWTDHIRRFGDYIIDLDTRPEYPMLDLTLPELVMIFELGLFCPYSVFYPYNDEELEARLWHKRGIQLLPLRRRNQKKQWTDPIRKIMGKIRHHVETIFSTLTTIFNIQRPRGRTLQGHVVRIASCILAHTLIFFMVLD